MKNKPKADRNKAKDVEGIKKTFGIKDRLLLAGELLPKQGNIIDLLLTKDIRKKIEFTQVEIKKFGIKNADGGGLEWNKKGQMKIVFFSSAEMEFLKRQIDDWDKQKKITEDMLGLCLMLRE